MPRFLSIFSAVERATGPSEAEIAEMGKLIEAGSKEGWLLSTEGCLPTALGARVRRADGKVTVKDGPFSESKEVVGGFAVIQARSKEHAIELTRRFLEVAGDGEVEIRQLYEVPALEPTS
jgi:hypothetical protein